MGRGGCGREPPGGFIGPDGGFFPGIPGVVPGGPGAGCGCGEAPGTTRTGLATPMFTEYVCSRIVELPPAPFDNVIVQPPGGVTAVAVT